VVTSKVPAKWAGGLLSDHCSPDGATKHWSNSTFLIIMLPNGGEVGPSIGAHI